MSICNSSLNYYKDYHIEYDIEYIVPKIENTIEEYWLSFNRSLPSLFIFFYLRKSFFSGFLEKQLRIFLVISLEWQVRKVKKMNSCKRTWYVIHPHPPPLRCPGRPASRFLNAQLTFRIWSTLLSLCLILLETGLGKTNTLKILSLSLFILQYQTRGLST